MLNLYNTFFSRTEGIPIENGFEDRTQSTISFDDSTRTFTITPVGICYYWSNEIRYAVTTPQTVVIPDIEGVHFIYYEGSTLKTVVGFVEELITVYSFVGVVYWNATQKVSIILGDERHGRVMDSTTHLYHHSTEGCKWGKGLSPSSITIGTGDAAVDAQIAIEAGTIYDEDIKHTIAGQARPMSAPLIYRSGTNGDWKKIDSTGYIVTTTGSGRAAWNEFTGTTWQLTESSTNDFVLSHLLATNDTRHPMVWLVGQKTYTTLALARVGADIEFQQLKTGQLDTLMPEFVFIATFILQSASGYSNAVKSKVVTLESGEAFVDLRKR